MNKIMLTTVLLIFQILVTAQPQSGDNYLPTKEDQRLGILILKETEDAVKAAGGVANYADYWNFATAYRYLGIGNDSILVNLTRSAEMDPHSFLTLIEYGIASKDNDIKNMPFYKCLGDQFINLINKAKAQAILTPKKEEIIDNIINQEVVNTLIEMMALDQQYRSDPNFLNSKENQRKQYVLDSLNTQKLYTIYKAHGYPGKSITGDNLYQNYFCLIVEHGQNQTGVQRFWLPIVGEAFKKGELNAGPLKMLLDRIHWLDTGKQYFGSHLGVPLESDEAIVQIRAKYGL